jgi:cysteinyl-tRNA synthetase
MFDFFSKHPADAGSHASLPPLRFFNTLSGKLEDFSPLTGREVKMYNCGPTVYGTQHIGNMRAAVFADTLRRILSAWGYKVKQVINITDFGHLSSDADEGEDKMTIGLKAAGMELSLPNMRTLAEKYTQEYFADIEAVGVDRSQIIFPRASDYIPEDISLILSLEQKGYAYPTDQGVYYDVSRFPSYGKLGNINLVGLKEGARVQENAHKRGPLDFILWKSDKKLGWDSPWGLGFPGWHIECSAMIFKLLGKQIDIHTGGIEHIPVHHNNEIAQAEAVSGKQFVKYWLHNDHITIEGKKISKSLGNTVYVHNIADRGFSPLALRYWFLTAHYRTQANFTWDAIQAADTALSRMRRLYLDFEMRSNGDPSAGLRASRPDEKFVQAFFAALGDDLDSPKALALTWDMIKDPEMSPGVKYANLTTVDHTLALGLAQAHEMRQLQVIEQSELPDVVQEFLHDREEARANKDFSLADELRGKIFELGYEVTDTAEGPKVTPRE